MSLFVLAPEVVWNPAILKFSSAPRKILQRGLLFPKGEAGAGLKFRLVVESQFVRYFVTLIPFIAAGVTWPQLALPLGSAPILMLIAIGLVELRLLRIPAHQRAAVMSEAEAARVLDTLTFRGRRVLTELAARRGVEAGTLYLVIEQSDLARIPPLTLVSLQCDAGKSRLVPLTAADRAVVRAELFDAGFTEAALAQANQREGVFFRSVAFEARGVSAHARLAAVLDQPAEAAT